MSVKKYLETTRAMILRVMQRIRLGIWLLGWKISKGWSSLRNKWQSTITIRFSFRKDK